MVNSPKKQKPSKNPAKKFTKKELFVINTITELKKIPIKTEYTLEEALYNNIGMFILTLGIDDIINDNPPDTTIKLNTKHGMLKINT
jgi:hypothetical protein